MPNYLSTFCLLCFTDPKKHTAKSIAIETLRGLENILKKEFFPISLQEKLNEFRTGKKTYQPKLLSVGDIPTNGIVKDTLFKKQLVTTISEGLKQTDGSAWDITAAEESAVSTQIVHSIFMFMLSQETQFNYHEEFLDPLGIFNEDKLPHYGDSHQDDVKKFLEAIRSFPNGTKVELKTQNPVEHNALNLHLAKTISEALTSLDIANLTSTTLHTFRSQKSEKQMQNDQEVANMFKNPLDKKRT